LKTKSRPDLSRGGTQVRARKKNSKRVLGPAFHSPRFASLRTRWMFHVCADGSTNQGTGGLGQRNPAQGDKNFRTRAIFSQLSIPPGRRFASPSGNSHLSTKCSSVRQLQGAREGRGLPHKKQTRKGDENRLGDEFVAGGKTKELVILFPYYPVVAWEERKIWAAKKLIPTMKVCSVFWAGRRAN